MEFDSVIRVLREMRVLEAFVASIAIVGFTGAVIALTVAAKSFLRKRLYNLIRGR